MQEPIRIKCHWCDKFKDVPAKEYNRQRKKGRKYFFCSLSCSVSHTNSLRDDLTKEITKTCPVCNHDFTTRTGKNEKTFCSRSCASVGSVTPYRREKAREIGIVNAKNFTIEGNAKGLRIREAWKYKKLKKALTLLSIDHRFEYFFGGNYIFDLALLQEKILVEFDGREHDGAKQKALDKERDAFAVEHGWVVIRISVASNAEIQPKVIKQILSK